MRTRNDFATMPHELGAILQGGVPGRWHPEFQAPRMGERGRKGGGTGGGKGKGTGKGNGARAHACMPAPLKRGTVACGG